MPAEQALAPGHIKFPTRLNDLDDLPKELHVQGEVPEGPAVAIVGSRAADRQGLRFAYRLASDLGREGVTVVSGGAQGIDQAAHRGALDGGGKTVIVLGCGLNIDYPRGSRELRERAAESGAVVSELESDAKPRPVHFPKRNRIVAALSQAVVVIQAAEKSGALITARLGRALDRIVMAVPGIPGAELTRGTHGLLKDGALLVDGMDDVLEAIGLARRGEEGLRVSSRIATLSGLQAAVAKWLSEGPATVDELSRGLEKPVGDVLTTLVQLEVDGVVAGCGGNYELS
jgi:DNA processing protein